VVVIVGQERVCFSNVVREALARGPSYKAGELGAFSPDPRMVINNLLNTVLTNRLDSS
jgi:hypothetical protein